MKPIEHPIALRAFERAYKASRVPPKPRKKTDSRTADKFVVRGYNELFEEMAGIGLHQGRSINSEVVAAILEALSGFERSSTMQRILTASLGESLSARVLASVPNFDLGVCTERRDFVVRFPDSVRDSVREDVKRIIAMPQNPKALSTQFSGPADVKRNERSMNTWVLKALVAWIKIQRQQFALLSAAIELEKEHSGAEAETAAV
ncbi:Arc family DNA-binding protein [Pseudomonas baetica]|uniref:Arc family DNA-binding protein n=1 Tax=Pseudomonas baetica TaxID=674054 RepID=UPI0024055181|nr:Arc family DNA-binding protein [Pseudomonas baetica]MDF9778941.1 putative HicB family RNase H-like nuclease [Pseudomonas baetica]